MPFTEELVLSVSGSSPFTGTFVWGDGGVSQSISNNGTTSIFDVTHSYTVVGNYTLAVTIQDAAGSVWKNTYKVSAWKTGFFGLASVSARIEGYGIVSALQRMRNDQETITVFFQNTGSAYLAPITATFYAGSWANQCDQELSSLGLLPGDWGYLTWVGNYNFLCEGQTPVWAKITSTSWPALNATSPQMSVTWSTTTAPSATFTVRSTVSTATAAVGAYSILQYQIVNTGQFTLDFYGSAATSPVNSAILFPADLGNPSHALTVNQSAQQVSFGGAALYQGVGRILLQPGQAMYVNRTFQVVASSGTSSITLTDTLQSKCPISLRAGGGDSYLACGLQVGSTYGLGAGTGQVSVSISLTIAGASIAMTAAIPLGNGTEQFQGTVVSMGSNTPFLTVWFVFWKTAAPATQYTLQAGTIYAAGTVTATATGLAPNTNYTVQFAAQSSGPAITSNQVAFVTQGGCTGTGCAGGTGSGAGSPPANFVLGFLFFLSSASGVPVEIFGFFLGLVLIATFLLAVLVIPRYLGAESIEIPELVWAALIPTLVIVNVLFFLWPSWVLILVIVPEAILLASYFMRGGEAGANG